MNLEMLVARRTGTVLGRGLDHVPPMIFFAVEEPGKQTFYVVGLDLPCRFALLFFLFLVGGVV